MAIPYLTATDIERAISAWPDARLPALCNAIIWAYASNCREAVRAAFTERDKVRDLGVDAAVEVGDESIPGPLLSRGWNVFQFKRRDAVADRLKAISGLKQELKGAARKVAESTGRDPDTYTLFTNLSLSSPQNAVLRDAIREGSSAICKVIGAAELAAMLTDLPQIRAGFFGVSRFETWQDSWDRLRKRKLGVHVELVARGNELSELKTLVDNPSVRVVLVHGLPEVGKDRLILEATRHRAPETLCCLDPDSPDLQELQEISSSGREVILVVQDADHANLKEVIPRFLVCEKLKLVCSVPTLSNSALPSYGFDDRVRSLALEGLDEIASRELLKKAGATFDDAERSWVVRETGGLPGLLLLAGSLGRDLRRRTQNFFSAVGENFRKHVGEELGDQALRALETFSLLTRVHESEIEDLCRITGQQAAGVRSVVGVLQAAGLVQQRSGFAEVRPPILAQYMVSQLLAQDPLRLAQLVMVLRDPARIRFYRRLRELPRTQELQEFWTDLLRELCSGDEAFQKSSRLLPIVAEAVPELVIEHLEGWLRPLPIQARSAIQGQFRRDIAHTLDVLLLHAQSSARSTRLLLLVAEAENEQFSNNSSGVFSESFNALHPQVASTLDEREAILRDVLKNGTEAQQLLVVRAASEALRRLRGFTITWRPLETFEMPQRPPTDHTEIRRYSRALLQLLVDAAEGSSETVATAAQGKLVESACHLGFVGEVNEAVSALRKCLDLAIQPKSGVDPGHLAHWLERVVSSPGVKHHESLLPFADAAREILVEMERSSLKVQIQRWLSDRFNAEESLKQIDRLATTVAEQPDLLTPALFEWLVLDPKGSLWFRSLGKRDEEFRCRDRIQERAAKDDAAEAFGSYCGGWGSRDIESLRQHLDRVPPGTISGQAMLRAVNVLAYEGPEGQRLVNVVRSGKVSQASVASILYSGPWLDNLRPEEFLFLLGFIAGPSLEQVADAVELLDSWSQKQRPLEGPLAEFAWKCLEAEAPPQVVFEHSWHFDQLAARLTVTNADKGFELLGSLLRRETGKGWNPVEEVRTAFWSALVKADRRRAVTTLFHSDLGYLGSGLEGTLLDLPADSDLLVELARQNLAVANRIARAMDFDRPGVWDLACKLTALYPNNDDLRDTLSSAVLSFGFQGSPDGAYQARISEVERLLKDPGTPVTAKTWLRQIEKEVKRETGKEVIWEYDLDARDLQRFIDRPESPEQRLWAISRILKFAKWEDVQRMLTVRDIKEALPLVDLPESTRRALESAVEFWETQYHHA